MNVKSMERVGWAAAAMAVVLVGAGCKPGASARADTGAEQAAVHVETATVAAVDAPQVLRLTGSLKGDKETDLAANAVGRVMATAVERGQAVTAGQLLARLDVRAASLTASEAKAQAESVQAQEAQARSECARYETLRQKGAISDLEYDKVATQCKTLPLSAQAASARARLAAQNVGDGLIRAPFPGVVTERYVDVGEYVRQDSRVVTIVSLDPLRLEVAVPEAHVGQVKEGADVSFTVSAHPERRFVGKVKFVSGALRAATRDLVVEALVSNEDKALKPGMFADVEVVIGKKALPSVPRASVVEREGRSRAYFVVDGRLEERVLSLGPVVGDVVSVDKGAKVGDKVAVGDVSKLTNGAPVR